jgi:hypothetical protein
MAFVYVKHPVSSELKKKIVTTYGGHKIRDIRFKPDVLGGEDVIFDTENPPETKIVKRRKAKASE